MKHVNMSEERCFKNLKLMNTEAQKKLKTAKTRSSGLELLTFTLQEILFTLVKVNICILSSGVCPAAGLQTGEMEYSQKLEEGKHFIILEVRQDKCEDDRSKEI